jgi:hypothetical protein
LSDDTKQHTAFRAWLIERLATSRWPIYLDDTDELIAARIGVQVDVLREARALVRAREKKPDRRDARLGMPRAQPFARFHIFLEPPPLIYAEWKAQCRHRDQTNACLLRSIVHHVLRLKVQPDWVTGRRREAWFYQGEWLGQQNIREHRYRMHTYVTEPCYRALTERARATHVTASAIVRWGVCAFLEGKFRKFQIVTSLDSLYNDSHRYCTKPIIWPEDSHG